MEPDSKSRFPQIPGWVWWVILAFLIAWNVGLFKLGTPSEADIPYSTFVAQIQAGNVESVTIVADEITGTFVDGISLPASEASAAQTPTALPPSAPAPVRLYTDFRTTFPESVGDSSLMSLLEAQALDRLVDALLYEETVDREALEQLLGARPEIEVEVIDSKNSLRDSVEVTR
jgi:ATP-dependent Zn protease